MNNEAKLTKFVQAAGCAAKMGPGDLKQSICSLAVEDENILVGFDNSEDASAFQINNSQAIVQTLDFITPVVDDPYIYGQIAAANALSDVFAMGADVKTALNIVGFDKAHHPTEVLKEMLEGGNSKIRECGGALMGGHTIESLEMYYGLSVTGLIHPKNILQNNTGREGHVLILTKPLGTGILSTAIKRDMLSAKSTLEAAKIMSTLNHKTSALLKNFDVSACTDITGFGLLGHAYECCNEDISLHFLAKDLPVLPDTLAMAQKDSIPGGSKRNMKYVSDKTEFLNDSIQHKLILSDAQTSGGLLIAMKESDAYDYIKQVEDYTFGYAKIVGYISKRENKPLVVH